MFKKLIFFFDIFKVLGGEVLGYFSNFFLKNKNIDRLFKLEQQNKTKTLLIVSNTNLNYSINIESLFAKYFNLAGYTVYFLTNFKEKNAVETFRKINGNIIYHNFLYLKNSFKYLFKKLPEVKSSEELKNFKIENIDVGTGVYSSVSRKLKIGQIDFSNERQKRMVRKFLWRSIVFLDVAKDILDKIKPSLILALEKGYVSNCEIFNLAVERGIDFIQWCGCQEPNALMFKRYNKNNKREHPHSISKETWEEFLRKSWNPNYENEVYRIFEKGYLQGTWFGFINLLDNVKNIKKEEFIRKYNLNPNKKIAVLFSHIMWDANLFYGKDLFDGGFEEWLIESVKVMRKNENINWLIKIHPANKFKYELEGLKEEYREIKAIKENFGEIPENIRIIYPEDNINPYSLFKIIDYGITVRGTIGMELPCFGIPVLTAGTGRYSGFGFTIDSASKEEYLDKLTNLEKIPKLNEQQKRLAILYAFIVFKARPLRFISFKEKYFGKKMDIDILIKKPEEGKDFLKFVNWAINSKEEDFIYE